MIDGNDKLQEDLGDGNDGDGDDEYDHDDDDDGDVDELQDDLSDGNHRRHTTNAIILVGCKVCIPSTYFKSNFWNLMTVAIHNRC